LVEGLRREAKAAGVAFSGDYLGGMFGVFFRAEAPKSFKQVMEADTQAFNRFFHAMLERGVYLAPSAYEAGFVSAAHTDADVAATVAAAKDAFARVRAG
jgi:glutamate-1-semialdehyde 2,1-aminomutase